MAFTLPSAIAWWAKMQPDVVAFNVDGRAVTFRDYHHWADRVAVRLIEDGVKPGDRVAISAVNSLEYCVLNQGAIRAGAITFPLNTRFTRAESAEVLEDIAPKMLFCDERRRETLDGLVPLRAMDEIAALREGPRVKPDLELDPDWPVVIISTSGSTAKPKGVVMTHRTVLHYVTEYSMMEPINRGARVLGIAPMSSSGGFVQTNQYTSLGCTLFMESVFEPRRALQILLEEDIAACGLVPLMFERIAQLPEFENADLSGLKVVTVGGSRVTERVLEAWMGKGVTMRQNYGQTEAGGNSTIMPAHLAFDAPEKTGWGGIFTDHKVVRADGSECDPGEVGEILIRSPAQMIHYWNNPEATAKAVPADGWIRSGDLGFADEDGLITFVDRLKDIIVSGGLNISAAEVERAVGRFPGVLEVVVIAAPDPKFTETPMAVLYADRPIDVPALIEHCNACLADYKVPRYVVVEDQPLPQLANGKLSKPAVRELYKDVSGLPRVR